MARPKQVSDEEVFSAAQRLYMLRGHQHFTLSELARELDISRSAIIQRFEGVDALKRTLSEQALAYFEQLLGAVPASRSGASLMALAECLGNMLGGRAQLASFLQGFQADLADEALAQLDTRRTEALFDAVSERMPEMAIEHDAAVEAFVAHLGGTLLQWQVLSEDVNPSDFLSARTRVWLRLAGIPLEEVPVKQGAH